jgi:hypothetical protein
MKPLLITIISIALTCCNTARNDESKYDSARKAALTSNEHHDTIFLDYRFGMSEAAFQEHTAELMASGKLQSDDRGLYYMLHARDHKSPLVARFSPSYHNDELYELGISCTGDGPTDTPQLMELSIVGTYMDQYYPWFIVPGYLKGSTNYFHVKGNREIRILQGIDDARIFYTDIQREAKKTIDEDAAGRAETEKSKGDL